MGITEMHERKRVERWQLVLDDKGVACMNDT